MKRILKKVSRSLESEEKAGAQKHEESSTTQSREVKSRTAIEHSRDEGTDEKAKRKRKRKRKPASSFAASAEESDSDVERGNEIDEDVDADDEKNDSGPANNRTVYIEGLPFDASEDDVRNFFKSVTAGSICSVRLPRWHDSKRLRGYGHVEFSTPGARKEALNMDGTYMGKRFIKVAAPMVPRVLQASSSSSTAPTTKTVIAPSGIFSTHYNQDKSYYILKCFSSLLISGCRRVFVKNLPYECTEEEVQESFKECGKILSVRLAVWGHTGNMFQPSTSSA